MAAFGINRVAFLQGHFVGLLINAGGTDVDKLLDFALKQFDQGFGVAALAAIVIKNDIEGLARERRFELSGVGAIALNLFHPSHRSRTVAPIEQHDLMALFDQKTRQINPDEAGATHDQNAHLKPLLRMYRRSRQAHPTR